MSNEQENVDLSPSQMPGVGTPDPGTGASQDGSANEGQQQHGFEQLTPEQFKALQDRANSADELKDKYVRLAADFDNYKKRAAREKTDASKYANESLLERLLPVLDNFEAALTAVNSAQSGNVDSLKTGVQMIFGQLKATLSEMGLEEIDATGKSFDPNLHEAVSQQPSADVPEGQVLQQLRKGYKLRDRLIRPAMVVVSRKA